MELEFFKKIFIYLFFTILNFVMECKPWVFPNEGPFDKALGRPLVQERPPLRVL
jgi:hypothetical protein